MNQRSNASAWSLPGVLRFFEDHRTTSRDVYRSEWFFIKDRLRDGMTVLDIGCAQGGFAAILAEHVKDLQYTGVDISAAMVEAARARFPQHRFLTVPEGNYAALGQARYDLVLVLGILHLHETWRETISTAWRHTGGSLILDLRETDEQTVEDKSLSYMRMDFNRDDDTHREARVPYNVINSHDAQEIVRSLCPGARAVNLYGYETDVAASAVVPRRPVKAMAYCVER